MRSLKGIVLCAAFWLLWAPTVSAQPQRPSEFFIEEFTFGLLGGLVGGPTVELLYVGTLCREVSTEDKELQELCQGLGFMVMQIAVYGITLPIGTSFGIIVAGSLRGIVSTPPDWIFTYIFAMAGSLTGWLNAAGVLQVMDFLIAELGWNLSKKDKDIIYTVTRIVLPILYASFLGTMEFNIRIQPQSLVPQLAASSWRVPLFMWRF